MKAFRIVLYLTLLVFSMHGNAQQQGVIVSAGCRLPNDAGYSYLLQPSLGLRYLCDWTQPDGWMLGCRADIMATRNAVSGTRYSLSMSIEDRLWRSLYEVFEVGLSVYSNPYSHSHDDDNRFIGSWLNCHIGVGFRFRHAIDSTHQLSLGVRLVHSSNGYLRKPNLGLNYLHADIGFHFGSGKPRRTPSPVETVLPSTIFFCSYAPSVVQQRGAELDAAYCYAHSFIMGALHPFDTKRSLGGEVDLMYNFSHDLNAKENGFRKPFPLYMGICATYQRDWNPFFIRVSLGTDLIRSPYQIGDMYERISMNYRVAQWSCTKFYVGVACKAYYGHIDYIEWTLGFEF